MRFEGEEVPEKRFSGTIVGVGDNISSGWADSEWRSLKVQWDEPSMILRPERASPWELEPLVATTSSNSQPVQRSNKRARPSVLPSSTPDMSSLGKWKFPIHSSTFSYGESQCGQDLCRSPSLSTDAKTNSFAFRGHSPLAGISPSSMFWPNRVESVAETFSPAVNKDPGDRRQSTRSVPRLFGFKLVESSNEEDNMPVNSVSAIMRDGCPGLCLDTESDWHSEPSNVNLSEIPSVSCEPPKSSLRSPQELQSRQTRSCTKVHMQGIAVGRAVDLTRFECYDDLLRKLEEMFDIDGELCGSTKKWQVVYTDDEDDMMMVGDDPWHEFCSMVRKIFIYTSEEVKRLSPKIKFLGNEVKGTKPDADAVNTEDHSSVVGPGC
uniref:Auxin-responsive protein n=1 Tax=Rhizophora mucronata TaxID=61149 RepID=A0A2P2PHZ7_RHIMU